MRARDFLPGCGLMILALGGYGQGEAAIPAIAGRLETRPNGLPVPAGRMETGLVEEVKGTTEGMRGSGTAQTGPAEGLRPAPAKERFIDSIYRTIVDSTFTRYLLVETARPCSMIKFDYDEWVKYAMLEDVPIGVMNELGKKAYENRGVEHWEAAGLVNAHCVEEGQADSILGAGLAGRGGALVNGQSLSRKERSRLDKRFRRWQRLPAQDRTVFNFSVPLFTDDGLYALIDLDRHCDARQCGLGVTCIFHKTAAGWRLAGRMVRWGG